MSVYLDLTREFNRGRVRAVLSSGQAVVLHRLALASKDGDWILREDQETLDHVLEVLEGHDARYRFGAPLDLRWLGEGWSAHFQYLADGMRVRTDFVTRPPRMSEAEVDALWREAASDLPYLGLRQLLRIKMTDREKDWPVVGELARRLDDPEGRLRYGRSARDLAELAAEFPEVVAALAAERPLLARIAEGRDALEALLDAERRALMRENEARLGRYEAAAAAWATAWPETERLIAGCALREAHARLVERAETLLPQRVAEAEHDA